MSPGAPVAIFVSAIALATAGAHASPRPAISRTVQQPERRAEQSYGCILCHADKRRAFLLGVHSERGIRCHDCHGGDPSAVEKAGAHRGDFVGAPEKIGTVRICSSCHSDPDQMRQYGLPVGQVAEFRTSRHGQLLLDQQNNDAPTCTDCHDAHTILRPNDARSRVYPTNIPATCAHCHENVALMRKYGLRTDQVEKHRDSVHGVRLYEQQNFAAPTCVSCHGSHAALPPAVAEIANVCGQCHVLVRRAFYRGAHGDAALAGKLPGCTACHSNHGTERVRPDRIAATCVDCHDRDSPAALVGLEIQERVARASDELKSAEAAIRELVGAGHQVADIGFRYQTAVTAYQQIAQAQHSLDLEVVEELSRQVGSISRDIRGSAEVSAEHRWEHKLLLVPVWFLALAASVLAWFKLRGLREREL